MAFAGLFLIAILTVTSGATPLYCSDVQSQANGNENTDVSQITTLQYCIMDNCTIMRIDTGQQLDIVYTTGSLLIVTTNDSQTSMVITKIDDDLPCLKYLNTTNEIQAIQYVRSIIGLSMVVSAYVIIVHLLFKTFCSSLFGKLLMFHNLFMVLRSISVTALDLMHFLIAVNSQTTCHITTIIFALTFAGNKLFATNILTHCAYLMYRCYHLKSTISKKRLGFLFRCYTTYAGCTLILIFFVTIAYDWRTGMGENTNLANGHCSYVDPSSFNTLVVTNSK